jgi:hypothetical protein
LVAVVSGGQIYTSIDSGVTWTVRNTNRNWSSVASDSAGNKLVAVVSGGQIYTSIDSGVTWTARDTNRYWTSVASNSAGDKLVTVINGGQIYTKDLTLKTLTVSGAYNKITFINSDSTLNNGIVAINSFGTLNNIAGSFNNLIGLTSIPNNWNNIIGAGSAFAGCSNLLSANINNSNNTIIDMSYCFYRTGITNFSISNSSSITNMTGMFRECSSLNSDFTGFSLSGLIAPYDLSEFMYGVTLSRENYNKILVYWSNNRNSYNNTIAIHMGNSKSDTTSGGVNGVLGKLNLVSYGWTITDADGTVT